MSPELCQLGFRDDLLDKGKQLALFPPNVLLQLTAKQVQLLHSWGFRDIRRKTADPEMVHQHPSHDWLVWISEACQLGKQDLFLFSEVTLSILVPVIPEQPTGGVCALPIRAFETLRHHQGVVVVARQVLEGWVAVHDAVDDWLSESDRR